MKNKKIIIGLVGEIGCGKDAASDYLKKKYGATMHRFSTSMTDCLNRLAIPTTRENLIAFSEITRAQFGQDLYANVIVRDCIDDPSEIVIANGIRRFPDIEGLSKLKGFHLIRVEVPARMRYERIINRGEKAGESEITWEQFQEQAKMPTEASIREVAEKAEYSIDNSGTLEDLHRQIDELVTKLRQD